MDKAGIVAVIEEMVKILELGGEAKPFEIIAYRNGARAVDDFEGDLQEEADANRLTKIPGIGKRLAEVIGQLLREGRSDAHESMRGEFPETLFDLFGVPGLGAKKIGRLYRELAVDSLDSLEEAAKSGRISKLKRFGAKSEERILTGIERAREHGTNFVVPATEALPTERPKATGRVRIGTSGYSYPEWKGAFFPEGLAADDFLKFYSGRFSTVEVNNTFYRFPTPRLFEEWLPVVPDTFTFAVKANIRITHRGRLVNVETTTDSFLRRCQILGERLGPVLFQLPPDFHRDDARLDGFLSILPPTVRCAMEFRHASWHHDAVYARLKEANVAWVVSDEEALPAPRVITSDFTYVRFRRDHYEAEQIADWREWVATTAASGCDVFGYLKHKEDGTSPEPIVSGIRG